MQQHVILHVLSKEHLVRR